MVFADGDRLRAGPGCAAVGDGEGDDDGLRGGTGADVVDGRGGRDVLAFGTSRAPVVADLAAGTVDWRGATDRVVGVEGVAGGRGADTLLRGGGPDDLEGGGAPAGARDVLRGRGGDDAVSELFGSRARLFGAVGDDRLLSGGGPDVVLRGGPGVDELVGGTSGERFAGGAGDDVIASGTGVGTRAVASDRVVCGPGTDTVRTPGFADRLARDCEWVTPRGAADLRVSRALAVRGGRAHVGVGTVGAARGIAVLLLADAGGRGGRELARSRPARVGPGRVRDFALPLPRRRIGRRVQLVLLVRGPDGVRRHGVAARLAR